MKKEPPLYDYDYQKGVHTLFYKDHFLTYVDGYNFVTIRQKYSESSEIVDVEWSEQVDVERHLNTLAEKRFGPE